MFTLLTGKVTDFSWPDDDTQVTASDGSTYERVISIYSDSCVGHRGSDVFPYGLLDGDETDFAVRTGIKGNPAAGNIFTNREALLAMDPRENNLPYIYDNFEWTHCAADGYNFTDAWYTPENPIGGGVDGTDGDGGGVYGLQGVSPVLHEHSSNPASPLFRAGHQRFPRYSFLEELDQKHVLHPAH